MSRLRAFLCHALSVHIRAVYSATSRKIVWELGGPPYLAVVEMPPPLLHLFSLISAVVVLVEHVWSDVRAVADDVFGHLAVEVVSDPTSPQRMRTHARGAVECLVVHHGLAAPGITPVRKLSSGNAGPRVAVAVSSQCRSMHSTFL